MCCFPVGIQLTPQLRAFIVLKKNSLKMFLGPLMFQDCVAASKGTPEGPATCQHSKEGNTMVELEAALTISQPCHYPSTPELGSITPFPFHKTICCVLHSSCKWCGNIKTLLYKYNPNSLDFEVRMSPRSAHITPGL